LFYFILFFIAGRLIQFGLFAQHLAGFVIFAR
jgi:hypothetical protein